MLLLLGFQSYRGMWRYIQPVDAAIPPAGAVSSLDVLRVKVIDPDVISVDWSVDGQKVVPAVPSGGAFDIGAAHLTAGSHTIEARAYDNADMGLIRQSHVPEPGVSSVYSQSAVWKRSQQTVTWTVTIP